MDPKKFEAMRVRVDGARGIAMRTAHIDGQYRLHYSEDVEATRSAHIVLFSLVSNASGLIFRGRWDNAASAVDIDLEGSRRHRLAFKWGLPGYVGHHTTQIAKSPRKYAIDIHIPNIHVFEGEITLGTKIGVRVEDTFHMTDEASAVVTRPNLLRRFPGWLRNFLARRGL